MNGVDKVKKAIESRNQGYTVTQMTDLCGLSVDVTDKLMVAVVNSGPPKTHPDQIANDWEEQNG